MTIAIDASTPAQKTLANGTHTAVTTVSFSPPANSLIVVLYGQEYSGSGNTQPTLTPSSTGTALTWQAGPSQWQSSLNGYAASWAAYNASAQAGITVKVTPSRSYTGGAQLTVLVLTGCASAQNSTGKSTWASNSSTAEDAPVTTTTAGAVVVAQAIGITGGTYTATGGIATYGSQFNDATGGNSCLAGTSVASPVTVPGTSVMGWTISPACYTAGLAWEILPAPAVPVADADTGAAAVFPVVPGLASPGAASPGQPSGTGGAADGGESVTAAVPDTDGTGSAADGGELTAAAVSDADAAASTDGGESLAVQSISLSTAMPSAAWLTRWRRQRFPRQLPLPAAAPVVSDGDAATGADGGEFVSTGAFTGTAVVRPPPSWRAAYRHTGRPQQPAFAPVSAMTVTASVASPGFTGGSVLQVYVLDGATQTGGAADAEALADQPGTGTLVPRFSGSFIGWAAFNDSQLVTANAAAAGNALDVNIAGAVAPVGAAGHCTGTVTAGTPVSYGLSNGTVGDAFVLAAAEVPPLVPGVPVALDPATPPGVSDSTTLTSLTSPGFDPPPGTVLVAVYGTANGGADVQCAFSVQDSRGLAWTLAAVVNFGGNFLAAVWTATVPTFALADADAVGPASDFVSAAASTGQFTVPDAGHGTDAGELTAAALPSADAGTGTDTAVIALADADAGLGTESDPSAVAAADGDAGTGTEAAVVSMPGSDTGHGTDGGEAVTATVPDTDPGHGTDGGEVIAQAGADAGTGTDAGEAVVRQDFSVLRLPASPSFRARYRHKSRPAVPLFLVTTILVTDAPDRGLGEDAEIDNPFPVDAEAARGADAGETVAQADSDASAATDVTFEFEFCHGTDLELTAWPGDADASLAFDTDGGNLFPVGDSDAGHGADGGEGVQQNVPKADADASHATADAGEQVTAAVPAADASGSTADGGEFIPKDSDAGTGTDTAGVASGLFASADFSLAFDVESRVLGPNNAVSDGDASGPAADGELVDVYAYVPLNRWDGGQFDVRRPGR